MELLDIFLTSLLGGALGGAVIMATAFFHFKAVTKEYRDAKDDMTSAMEAGHLQNQINEIKKYIKTLNIKLLDEEIKHDK